ncbi:MAG TPA: OmpA family protein [Candidatus Bathyarchaeia archaeon]|nr:OmpA family protein [Candidatus Bathyarchaeia archaeon]
MKQVAIFGAGIAGLTAAQELIERGFRVEVYETQAPSAVEDMAGAACSIGGMARSQWSRAERPGDHRPAGNMIRTSPILRLPQRIRFEQGSDRLDPQADATLARVAQSLNADPRIRHVEVRGFTRERTAEPYPDKPHGRLDWRRAETVVGALRHLRVEEERLTPAALGLGYRDEWTRPDDDRDYVSFHIIEDWIPGEHGFRFFPSFYRNLFDTMRRIPIAEARAVYAETSRTVLDNVIPTSFLGIDARGRKDFAFSRRPPASIQEVFDELEQSLRSMSLTFGDVARFNLKLFEYMTSCPERRAAEYESKSWADFLVAEEFSAAFQRYLDSMAETLVAMNAHRSDARTYGNISVQMLLDQISGTTRVDGTLNGPTSLAWFDHWRRYLENQGVEFHHGTLIGFEFFRNQAWPVVRRYFKHRRGETTDTVLLRDFYVLAISAPELKALVEKEPRLRGDDFDHVRSFPYGRPDRADTGGALEHMTGVQFYFQEDISRLDGHTVYPDSPWRLSSISQPQFWTNRRGWWSGYRGILSVDVSNLHEKGLHGRTAWESTEAEFVQEVLEQLRAATQWRIPDPILYHLDENLVFEKGGGRPALNKSPLMINRPGEYVRRPGKPGGYRLQFERLVLAGTYMQTFTRLTTMEAANESARHAVNAILDATHFPGTRCEVWDPEKNEPADLQFLVDLDHRLLKLKLPHLVKILDLASVPRALLRADPEQITGFLRAAHLAAEKAVVEAAESERTNGRG